MKIAKKIFLSTCGSLMLIALFLSVPAQAQDETLSEEERQARFEERRERMEQRRAEFQENNPEAGAQRDERRQRREEFLENNPEAQARMNERRERMRNGEGPPPGFEGRQRRPGGGPRRGSAGDNQGV